MQIREKERRLPKRQKIMLFKRTHKNRKLPKKRKIMVSKGEEKNRKLPIMLFKREQNCVSTFTESLNSNTSSRRCHLHNRRKLTSRGAIRRKKSESLRLVRPQHFPARQCLLESLKLEQLLLRHLQNWKSPQMFCIGLKLRFQSWARLSTTLWIL